MGNTTLTSEFNFHGDPEAAHIVLDTFEADKLDLVPWEFCVDHQLGWEFFDELAAGDTKASALLQRICGPYQRACRLEPDPAASEEVTPTTLESFVPCDAYAVLAAIHPETAVTESVKVHATVELGGNCARGMLAIDWYRRHNDRLNVNLLRKLDFEMFKRYFRKAFVRTSA